ncbi:MAG: hypothetical protein WC608_04780 [Parcubacteria group bacterium]
MIGESSKNISSKAVSVSLKKKVRSFFAEDFFRSHIVRWLALFIGAANLANWAALGIFIQPVDLPIIIHYNVYFGVDMLGDWKNLFLMPAIGLFLFLVNLSLSLYFYQRRERIASYLLLIATLMIQLSLIVASASMIIINY